MARRAKSGESGAASLAMRIAAVALSAASAATMSSASQPPAAGAPPAPATVSYRDYGGGETAKEAGKAARSLAEIVDAASKALLYSSAALSFAVDDFGTCGRRVAGVCNVAGEFCGRVRASGAVSIAAAVALAVSQYHVPISVSFDVDDDERKPPAASARGRHCRH
ncbi:hypothetical protein ACP4OV_002030 [Aristida adscensionis]